MDHIDSDSVHRSLALNLAHLRHKHRPATRVSLAACHFPHLAHLVFVGRPLHPSSIVHHPHRCRWRSALRHAKYRAPAVVCVPHVERSQLVSTSISQSRQAPADVVRHRAQRRAKSAPRLALGVRRGAGPVCTIMSLGTMSVKPTAERMPARVAMRSFHP